MKLTDLNEVHVRLYAALTGRRLLEELIPTSPAPAAKPKERPPLPAAAHARLMEVLVPGWKPATTEPTAHERLRKAFVLHG